MEFIGSSKVALNAVTKAKALAVKNEPFLVVGETGVGKTHFARFVHFHSKRKLEPFVVFDAAISENIEKELFGSARSSILGIENISGGALDNAGSGTIFIKNIHSIPLELQSQIVATTELGGYRPVNSDQTFKAGCRFVFSVPKSIEKILDNRQLTPELAQILNRDVVSLPLLKHRSEDIEILAVYFVKKWCESLGVTPKTLTKPAIKLLKRTAKNVSELQLLLLNSITSFSERIIDANHLQLKIDGNWHAHTEEHLEEVALEDIVEKKLKQFMDRIGKYDIENLHGVIMERIERPLIKLVMERSKNNQLRAAKILGINRNTLRSKLQKLEIL